MKEQDLHFFLNLLKKSLLALAHLPLIVGVFWMIGLCVCRPICALFPLPAALLCMVLKAKMQTRFPLRAALSVTVILALIGFTFLPAPSDVKWDTPYERAPQATLTGDTLHLRYVRDFEFYSQKAYVIRYLEEDFDLRELCTVHLIESRRRDAMAGCDLLFSFVFRDGRTLVFGPELRLPAKEVLNETQAFYKCYGLLYLFGTEEDMLRLRTNKKHEYLSLHTLRTTQQQAQSMLTACIRASVTSSQEKEAYPPFEGLYDGTMQQILRDLQPSLPYTLNEKVAHKLFIRGTLEAHAGETWETYQRRCAVGFDIAENDRKSYSTEIRRLIGAPALPAVPGERTVQEESRTTAPKREMLQVSGKEPGDAEAFTAPQQPTETRFTSGKGSALAEKIPEPGERLTVDTRDYSDEEYNSDGAEGAASSVSGQADAILEPKARMIAEALAETAAAEAKEKERKAAAEGRFKKKDADGKEEPVSDIDYNEMLLGRKSSGIKIIEKEKPAEEAHPLDPYKRRNPFEEEKKKAKTEEEGQDDFTAKPKPLHL